MSSTVQTGSVAKGRGSHPIAAALTRTVEAGAGATQIADSVTSAWHGIDTALGPILGGRGVAALYKRSLHLAATHHSWLRPLNDGAQAPMDLPALTSLLAGQSAADAASGGGALLQTFETLLVSLVGASLTQRLLAPVWATSFGIPLGMAPAQDTFA